MYSNKNLTTPDKTFFNVFRQSLKAMVRLYTTSGFFPVKNRLWFVCCWFVFFFNSRRITNIVK